jgi:hypothetical protein
LFSPNQIICIESGELRLFAEVIQMIPERDRTDDHTKDDRTKADRLWARPLALAAQGIFELRLLHDLREASQLILPSALFREALDTEVMPLMTELFQLEVLAKPEPTTELMGRRALQDFVGALFREPIAS